jgi:hypothetical protein
LSIVGDGFACAVWRHVASGRPQDYEHVLGFLGNAAQHVAGEVLEAPPARAAPEHYLRRESDAPNVVDEGNVSHAFGPERAYERVSFLETNFGPVTSKEAPSGTASLGALCRTEGC